MFLQCLGRAWRRGLGRLEVDPLLRVLTWGWALPSVFVLVEKWTSVSTAVGPGGWGGQGV